MKEKINLKNNQNNTIYYEIISILIVILLFITILKIGIIGCYLSLIIKIILGDYYFIFLIILFLYSLKLMFKFNLDLRSLRLNGIYLFFISLSLLSHKDLYSYSIGFNEFPINGLIYIYKMNLNNLSYDAIFGGGLILGIIYHFFYFLLGNASNIIYFIMFIISIIFISNNSIKDFIDMILNIRGIKIKNALNYLKGLEAKRNVDINILSDFLEEKRLLDKEEYVKIEGLFKKLNLEFKLIKYYVSYNYTLYIIDNSLDIDYLYIKLKEELNKECIIYYNNYLYLEVPNSIRYLLTLKNLVKDFGLSIGFQTKKLELNFNDLKNIFINGYYNIGITNYIKSLIAMILLYSNYNIIIYNLDIIENKRIKVYKNYEDFIKKANELINNELKNYILINNLGDLKQFDYYLRNSINLSNYSIYINRNEYIEKRALGLFQTKILFKSNQLISKLILNNLLAKRLDGLGDCLLINDKFIHFQTPFISKKDFMKLIRRF